MVLLSVHVKLVKIFMFHHSPPPVYPFSVDAAAVWVKQTTRSVSTISKCGRLLRLRFNSYHRFVSIDWVYKIVYVQIVRYTWALMGVSTKS